MTHDTRPVCAFCGTEAESVVSAIGAGWDPSFWIGDREYYKPVCPACCYKHTYRSVLFDRKLVLISGHEKFLNRGHD